MNNTTATNYPTNQPDSSLEVRKTLVKALVQTDASLGTISTQNPRNQRPLWDLIIDELAPWGPHGGLNEFQIANRIRNKGYHVNYKTVTTMIWFLTNPNDPTTIAARAIGKNARNRLAQIGGIQIFYGYVRGK